MRHLPRRLVVKASVLLVQAFNRDPMNSNINQPGNQAFVETCDFFFQLIVDSACDQTGIIADEAWLESCTLHSPNC